MTRKPAVAKTKRETARVRADNIIGRLDPMDDVVISGWAVDRGDPLAPLRLRVLIDAVNVDVMTCNVVRRDVKGLNLPSAQVGFSYTIGPRFRDGRRHVLTFCTIDGIPVAMGTRSGATMPELHFCLTAQTRFEGVLDGLVDGVVQGWALGIDDREKTKSGGLRLLVTEGGQPIAEVIADQFRGDVAEAMDADPCCGFVFSPAAAVRERIASLRFFIMPGRYELRGSPLEISFPGQVERDRMNGLIARADELFAYAYHLRRELKAALPGERYFLNDYARWAAVALPLTEARAVARYGALPIDRPLVSIICPVYRPGAADFLAAIDSVRAQTYVNWELLLVDDGSGDAALSGVLRDLATAEPRIRVKALARNGGISLASNAALKMAKGAFIAFFDHDDLLAPCALDVMLRAQAATGARMLYSDEDKIDRSGTLSEPHFKPAFNYRYLLEVNYICHFVMLDAALVRDVGGLDPRFDGAQDHDFLLRICEILPAARIHHVAEVLYHWRKSVSSTASGASAKPQAAIAGRAAVAGHLQRRKLAAVVTARGDLTCYQTVWRPTNAVRKAAGVSIIIPFRDHIELTAACVAAIREYTDDVVYEIILVDNWSSSKAAEVFCTAQGNMVDTVVVRVAEPFNYSRLNNLGALQARYGFLLLLNNDVFVRQRDWLRTMLNEMLVAPAVGAVGVKLLYPNGTVQHAGVVLGVGGIADHAFRGLPGTAPGYMVHAIAAQEVAAVTGACMLVRKAAYDAVGGLDEAELPVAFNDVDLCMKLTAAGWQIIFHPDVVAEHHESISRGDDFDEPKVARFMLENEVMRQRYENMLPFDPFYNQHFSREGGVYRELRVLK